MHAGRHGSTLALAKDDRPIEGKRKKQKELAQAPAPKRPSPSGNPICIKVWARACANQSRSKIPSNPRLLRQCDTLPLTTTTDRPRLPPRPSIVTTLTRLFCSDRASLFLVSHAPFPFSVSISNAAHRPSLRPTFPLRALAPSSSHVVCIYMLTRPRLPSPCISSSLLAPRPRPRPSSRPARDVTTQPQLLCQHGLASTPDRSLRLPLPIYHRSLHIGPPPIITKRTRRQARLPEESSRRCPPLKTTLWPELASTREQPTFICVLVSRFGRGRLRRRRLCRVDRRLSPHRTGTRRIELPDTSHHRRHPRRIGGRTRRQQLTPTP